MLRRKESRDTENLTSKIMGYCGTDQSFNKAVNWGIEHESVALEQYRAKHALNILIFLSQGQVCLSIKMTYFLEYLQMLLLYALNVVVV